MTLTTVNDRGLTTPIDLLDNEKIRFGTGDDLQIYHDGTNSILHNTSGNIFIQNDSSTNADSNIYIRSVEGEHSIYCADDGTVKLYYDGSEKLQTTSSGITVTGGANFSSNVVVDNGTVRCNSGFSSDSDLILNSDANTNGAASIIFKDAGSEKVRITGGHIRIPNDSGRLQLGTDQDFYLYHNGTNSFIDNGTGHLYIRGNADGDVGGNIYIQALEGDHGIILLHDDGIYLYYDDSLKAYTTPGGFKVDNKLELPDGGPTGTAARIVVGDGNDLRIYHDGSNSFIENHTGSLNLYGDDVGILNKARSAWKANFVTDGAVELYHSGNKKFETTSAGIEVNDGASAGSGITAIVKLNGAPNNTNDGTELVFQRAGSNAGRIQCQKVNDNNTSDLIFHTRASNTVSESVRMTPAGVKITSSGASPNNSNWDTASAVMTTGSYGGGIAMVDGSAGFVQYCHGSGANWELKSGATDATPETNIKATHGGAVSLYHNNSLKLNTSSLGVDITGRVTPTVDDTYDLGYTNLRWDDIYATNSTIETSDRNEKEDITATDLGLEFVNKLTPVSFKRKGKTRTHYGLVAQDVETVITDLGKTTTQFAPLIKDTLEDGIERYGLRYTELISPLIKAIQELSAEVEALKAK